VEAPQAVRGVGALEGGADGRRLFLRACFADSYAR
jgi:hypothetical protein